MRAWATVVVISVALACRQAELPVTPPRSGEKSLGLWRPAPLFKHKPRPEIVLRKVAGPRGRNCGVGRDAASDVAIYECGSNSIVSGTPFFCIFEPWPSTDRASVPIGQMTFFHGYAYSEKGSLFVVQTEGNRGAVADEVWRKNTGAIHTLSMTRGMKPPLIEDLDGLRPKLRRIPPPRVFVSFVIAAGGVVEEARAYGAISGDEARAVQVALRGRTCRPARLFGIPVPVIFYSAFDISNGTLRLFRPQPNAVSAAGRSRATV
jgi:hypothetical protein